MSIGPWGVLGGPLIGGLPLGVLLLGGLHLVVGLHLGGLRLGGGPLLVDLEGLL